ncbi:hypothetical protein LCGC14_0811980 [marine sediment metagenome]
MVLSDLSSTTKETLKTTIEVAKIIGGEIQVFSVKRLTEVVDVDNQLSAMRSINTEHSVIDKKLKKMIDSISGSQDITISYSFAFGNIKNQISRYIDEKAPDIIVLGKRKNKPLSFIGDSITEFVLTTFEGPILIASDKLTWEPEQKLSIGILNGCSPSQSTRFASDLMLKVKKPIKSFKFVNDSEGSETQNILQEEQMVEYAFDYTKGAINGLSKYVSQNKVDLLFLDRESNNLNSQTTLETSDIRHIINKSKVSLLISDTRIQRLV